MSIIAWTINLILYLFNEDCRQPMAMSSCSALLPWNNLITDDTDRVLKQSKTHEQEIMRSSRSKYLDCERMRSKNIFKIELRKNSYTWNNR
jgi:hypothetical protein